MIDTARLDAVPSLTKGSHPDIEAGACIMEAVSYITGEPWSDHPACACPVITAFLVVWNDALPDDERDALLRPLIPRVVGTRGNRALERRRAMMAADWLIRVHAPAWLRLAKLDAQAAALEELPEITGMVQCHSLMPALGAARADADAAWAAAADAARAAAQAAAWVASPAGDAAAAAARAASPVWAAAGDASAAADAARAASRAAAWVASPAWAAAKAGDAALGAAQGAAWSAAWDAARDALRSTRGVLQKSALALVERMIEVEGSKAP